MAIRSIWTLNEKERQACTMLSKMKSTDNIRFDKCEDNDRIYDGAKELLGGEDPIAFAIECLMGLYGSWNEEYFRNQYKYYLM